MVLEALKEYGELTTDEIAELLDKPKWFIEEEIHRLQQQGLICTKKGVHYIPPKTSFATALAVVFLVFVSSWVLVGAW